MLTNTDAMGAADVESACLLWCRCPCR